MRLIRWTTEASDQFEAVIKHIQQDNPTAARKVAKKMMQCLARPISPEFFSSRAVRAECVERLEHQERLGRHVQLRMTAKNALQHGRARAGLTDDE